MIGLEENSRISNDIIVGDFFVCVSNEEGNLTSLNDKNLDAYTKLFYEPQEFTKEEIEETAVIEFYTLEWMKREDFYYEKNKHDIRNQRVYHECRWSYCNPYKSSERSEYQSFCRYKYLSAE